MAAKKQKRLSVHWSSAWDEQLVMKLKQLAIGHKLSFSAYLADILRREVAREEALEQKGKKK